MPNSQSEVEEAERKKKLERLNYIQSLQKMAKRDAPSGSTYQTKDGKVIEKVKRIKEKRVPPLRPEHKPIAKMRPQYPMRSPPLSEAPC